MKKIYFSLFLVCFAATSFGQKADTLHWNLQTYTDGATTGSFTNFYNPNFTNNFIDTVNLNITNSSAWNASSGGYPQISNTPIFTTPNTLQLYTNWTTKDSSHVGLRFANDSNTVRNVTFRINDIDKATPSNTSYIDSVSVMGYNGGVPVYPDTPFTLYDPSAGYTIVYNNTAFGNPIDGAGGNCPNPITTDPSPTPYDASVTVHFTNDIDSIAIFFGDPVIQNAEDNPATQDITIDSITFDQGNALLPVQLGSFTAQLKDENVVLDWNTYSELNNARFDVERSTDGLNFTTIGSVTGMGTTNIPHDYTYTDNIKDISSPLVYYRLNQVNLDGTSNFSKIVELKLAGGIVVQGIYPNPFLDKVQLQMNFNNSGVATVHLFDQNGVDVYSTQKSVTEGSNSMTLDNLSNLPHGLYIIQVTLGNSVYTDKILKQ